MPSIRIDRERCDPPVVCFPFTGSVIGGSHISALGLIRRLDRGRFTPLVILQHGGSAIGRLFREAGVAFQPAPKSLDLVHGRRIGIRQLATLAAQAPGLAGYLTSRRVRIVHSNDGRTHATWALPARLAGARLLWHHRGDPGAAGLRFAAPIIADRVVAVSQFAAPRASLLSAARRTRVIHSPFATDIAVDRMKARQMLLTERGLPPETRIVGFFGALIARKRPLLFVDAIAALARRAPGVPLAGMIFGESFDGADTAITARAAELGIAPQIHQMGFRTPGAQWIGACDILMVPAVDEPFGRTLIEAMLVGTPVVATASGGNVEALRHGNTGLLAPPEDAEALAAACAAIFSHPTWAWGIVANARRDARERFGEQRHAEAIMALYDEILAGGAVRDALSTQPSGAV